MRVSSVRSTPDAVSRSSASSAGVDGAAEGDVAPAHAAADAQRQRQRPLGARPHLAAAIRHVEERVLAPHEAGAALDARDRPARELALELDRRPALGAPRQRHADAAAPAEHVGERELRAVAQAVAVGERDDRQEHQAVAQLSERLEHRRRRQLHRMRPLVDQDHQHHLVGALDRAIALADVDRLEPVGRLEPLAWPRRSRPGASGAPTVSPASAITSASGVVWLPWTTTSARRSDAGAGAGDGPALPRRRGGGRLRHRDRAAEREQQVGDHLTSP